MALTVVVFGMSAGRAHAQTGPDLLVNPWYTGQAVDTATDATFRAAVHSDTGRQVSFDTYHSYGRWRIAPDAEATPRLGYDVLFYDFDTKDRAIPGHLWNTSVGFAQPVARIDKFFAVVTGSVGYAGTKPFSDSDAYYATGNLLVGRQFSGNKALIFDLNYDGNRTFLPDVPIPAVEYKDRVNDALSYTIGLPLNQISYRPQTGLQVDIGWSLVQTFSGRVGYRPDPRLELYGEYVDRLTGFHQSGVQNPDSRIFLQERRAGIGIAWRPTKTISAGISGGWAFGQELYRGFDVRNYTVVRHLADGPYGQARVEFGF